MDFKTVLLVIGVLLLGVIVVRLYSHKKVYIQVVGDFIVYNPKGVSAEKIKKGDVILGKLDDQFIIADVTDKGFTFEGSLEKYLIQNKQK